MKNFIIFILLIFITSCNNSLNTNSQKNNVYSDKILKVGIYIYDYPMLYLKNNTIRGFDYDIINEIANEENLKLKFIPIEFSKLIPALQTNYVDIVIAGMSITEERKKLVNFSDTYYSSSQAIIINRENEYIKSTNDLVGKTVGVISDTISDTIISEIKDIKVERFHTASTALLSLKVENVNAVMLDEITCKDYIKYDDSIKLVENIEFPEIDYGIAVRKDDDTLLQIINRGLNTIKSNGIYNEIVNKHIE